MSLSIRLGKESDHAYVVRTWAGQAHVAETMRDARAFIEGLLSRSMLRIAFVEGDEDAILGWAVVEMTQLRPCIHYVYCRGGATGCRRTGIARSLLCDLEDRPAEYSHRPESKDVKIPEHWIFAPERAL